MQFPVVIPDEALNTLGPEKLKEFIEIEFDSKEQHVKALVNQALKEMGKPTMPQDIEEEVPHAQVPEETS